MLSWTCPECLPCRQITPGTAHFGAGECTNGDGNGAYEVKVAAGAAAQPKSVSVCCTTF